MSESHGWQYALRKLPLPKRPEAPPRQVPPGRTVRAAWASEEIIELIKAAPCAHWGEDDIRKWIREEIRKASFWYRLKKLLGFKST